jgi:hypothetical protein
MLDLAHAWKALQLDWQAPSAVTDQAKLDLRHASYGLPQTCRLSYLVDLGLYAITHDQGLAAGEFLSSVLLPVLLLEAAPDGVDLSGMATSVRCFDNRHPFTAAARSKEGDYFAYEDQS